MSAVTLSGFNAIDFNQILELVMQQERQPVVSLQSQKTAVDAQKTTFSTLATKLAALESAAEDLLGRSAFAGTRATVSDESAIHLSASGTAPPGTYDVKVLALARSQVDVSGAVSSLETVVARSGSMTVGNTTITAPPEGLTLAALASAVNSAQDANVSASVVRTAEGYKLMLTGRGTGAASSFTVTNALAGGDEALVTSTQRTATDASIELNGVAVTSDTNTFSEAIAGASFTIQQELPNPVVVTITASTDSVKSLVEKVSAAFKDVTKFLAAQQSPSSGSQAGNIGRDPLVRGLRSSLAHLLTAGYATGGTYTSLAEVGFSFSRTGELQFDANAFDEAMTRDKSSVEALFRGADGKSGAFGALATAVSRYTEAGGLLPNTQDRLTNQSTKLTARIDMMEQRLEIRRLALQREFIAADQAIAQLNSQGRSLGSLY